MNFLTYTYEGDREIILDKTVPGNCIFLPDGQNTPDKPTKVLQKSHLILNT